MIKYLISKDELRLLVEAYLKLSAIKYNCSWDPELMSLVEKAEEDYLREYAQAYSIDEGNVRYSMIADTFMMRYKSFYSVGEDKENV